MDSLQWNNNGTGYMIYLYGIDHDNKNTLYFKKKSETRDILFD